VLHLTTHTRLDRRTCGFKRQDVGDHDRYLLDLTGHRELADALVPHVERHARAVAPLVRARSSAGAAREERWKLAVNASVEADL
jgi:hypothetical protein